MIARAGMQLVPEERRVFGSLNVEENIVLARLTAPKPGRSRASTRFSRASPSAAAAAAPTSPAASSRCWRSPARSCAIPKILLLDEPFEGLAPVIVRDLMNVCRKLAAEGQTIVLVEQNLAATLALATRAYIVNNGHVVHEAPTEEIKANPDVLRRYLGV